MSGRWRGGGRRQSWGFILRPTISENASQPASAATARRFESLWRCAIGQYSGVPEPQGRRRPRLGQATPPLGIRRGITAKLVAGLMAGSLALAQAPTAWAQGMKQPLRRPLRRARPRRAISRPPRSTTARARRSTRPATTRARSTSSSGQRNQVDAARRALPRSLRGQPRPLPGRGRLVRQVPRPRARQAGLAGRRPSQAGGRDKAMPGKVHVDSNPAGAAVTVDDKPEASPTPVDVRTRPRLARGEGDARWTPARLQDRGRGVRLDAKREPRPPARGPARAAASSARCGGRSGRARGPAAPAAANRGAWCPQSSPVASPIAAAGRRDRLRHPGSQRQERLRQEPDDADGRQRRHPRAHRRHGVRRRGDLRGDERGPLPDQGRVARRRRRRRTRRRRRRRRREEEDGRHVHPTPIVGPHSGGAGFVLRF